MPYKQDTVAFFNAECVTWLWHGWWLYLGANLFENPVNCVELYEPSMCRYPMGVSPLISHHNPAVIPTLWREGICHLAACFPLLSQEQSWALIYCEVSPRLAQSPCLPNYSMEETAHHEHDLFLEDCYPGQREDWLRSRLFLPCHPQLRILGERAVGFSVVNERMMENDYENAYGSIQ